MYQSFCVALGILLGATCVLADGRQQVDSTKETLSKWVETRQLIATTRADWESDREVLKQTINLFEKELATVNEQFTTTENSSKQIEKERSELTREKEGLDAATTRVNELLVPMEEKIRKMAAALPTPLVAKLEPLMARLPEDPKSTKFSAAERMQTLVGIVGEVEKFNGAITVHSEIQKNAKGEEVQVRTMYLGLGQAYWVDKSGRAGVGTAGPEGWKWSDQPELADTINRAIAIYENSQPAAFVSLPVTLK